MKLNNIVSVGLVAIVAWNFAKPSPSTTATPTTTVPVAAQESQLLSPPISRPAIGGSGNIPADDKLLALEKRLFDLINEERRKRGLNPVIYDAALSQVARNYSHKMATENFFEHTAPDGSQVQNRAENAGIRFNAIGENLAFAQGMPQDIAVEFSQGWMNSPGHRENILTPDWQKSGMGISIKNGKVLATQLFTN